MSFLLILFGANGDAAYDRYPFQVGQFESEIEMEDNLTNFILEGGGGGNAIESYDLNMYFAARKVEFDAYEKRGRRGYMFMVLDERMPKIVNANHVKQVFGDDLQGDIPIEDIYEELVEK